MILPKRQCCFSAQMNEFETRENLQREWGGWGSKKSIYFDFWGGKWTKWTLLCSPSRIYYDFPASISLRFNFILSKGRKTRTKQFLYIKKKESVDRLCDSCALWRSVNMSRAQPKKKPNEKKSSIRSFIWCLCCVFVLSGLSVFCIHRRRRRLLTVSPTGKRKTVQFKQLAGKVEI